MYMISPGIRWRRGAETKSVKQNPTHEKHNCHKAPKSVVFPEIYPPGPFLRHRKAGYVPSGYCWWLDQNVKSHQKNTLIQYTSRRKTYRLHPKSRGLFEKEEKRWQHQCCRPFVYSPFSVRLFIVKLFLSAKGSLLVRDSQFPLLKNLTSKPLAVFF